MFHLILFISVFCVATLASCATVLITYRMIGEINRNRRDGTRVPSFNFSTVQVFQEYRNLCPQGVYAKALVISGILAVGFSLIFACLLFGLFTAELPRFK